MGVYVAYLHMPDDTGARRQAVGLEELGHLVAERRRALGLSLRAAADQAKVKFNTLARVEKGQLPDLLTFNRIVEWLGLPVERFFEPTVRAESTPRVIAQHLRSDRALPPEAAEQIAGLVAQLYERLARPQPKIAVHLRAARTFEPEALRLMGSLLHRMQEALERRTSPPAG